MTPKRAEEDNFALRHSDYAGDKKTVRGHDLVKFMANV